MQRIVLITGAASGIGASLARRIAGPGTRLVLHGGGTTAESGQRLAAVRAACEVAGSDCLLTSGDLSEPGHGASAVAAGAARFGGLDQVVHAAGHVNKTALGELTRDGLAWSLAVMPGALLELVTAAMPLLAQSGCGRVVAVSSFVAHKIEAPSFAPASIVAKAALEALVRCCAHELAGAGVTVNAVVPGYTRKDPGKQGSLSEAGWAAAAARTPSGRLNEVDDVAAAIAFLLSAEARQITGVALPVDGGLLLG